MAKPERREEMPLKKPTERLGEVEVRLDRERRSHFHPHFLTAKKTTTKTIGNLNEILLRLESLMAQKHCIEPSIPECFHSSHDVVGRGKQRLVRMKNAQTR